MEIKVRLTLTDEALGMMPTDKEIHETYIAGKAPDAPSIEEEVAAVGVRSGCCAGSRPTSAPN